MKTKQHGFRTLMFMGAVWGCSAVVAGSASAQRQEGLVNVNIEDVTIQIPVAVAANICDVDVNALATALALGPTDCGAGTIALAEDDDGRGAPGRQEGLVNVNITNVDAQVPIAIAANICGVGVNVLANALDAGPVDCEAFGRSASVSE